MRDLLQRQVLTPLLVILGIQSILTMASYAVPVIASAAASEFGFAPSAAGAAVSIIYLTAMVVGLPSSLYIARLGALRVFQTTLLFATAGVLLFWFGHVAWAFIGLILIGCATAPMNPAGSHVLARVSPPRWQPLIFSIKQCGTPAGGMLATAILPPLIVLYGWQTALLAIPAFAFTALLLSALFGMGPEEPRRRGDRIALGELSTSLRFVWSDRVQRGHAFAGMAFAGCQLAMATYLIVYLWRIVGLAPELAGLITATVHVSGIVARILLGVVASRWIATRTLLTMLALIMAAALAAIALSAADWPPALFFLAAVVLGIGGNGWVGLFLSEITILAPEDRAADATSGNQFFMYGGIVLGPSLGNALIAATGSYAAMFAVFAALSAAAGISLYLVTRKR